MQGKTAAPGKRTLTSRLPTSETGGALPAVQRTAASGLEATQESQVGPGFGSPIPPVAEIRAWFAGPGPVQRKETDSPGPEAADVPAIANAGLVGAGSGLPHGEAIQRAFGRHDVSGVRAHVGSAAARAAGALGAEAYATGNHVAFASPPDLHTAAHEAAHVVQQRAGAVGFEGLNRPGDVHEQEADKVADAVVAGRSAETLLGRVPADGDRSSRAGSVQRRPNYNGGSPDTAGSLMAATEPVWAFEPRALTFDGAGDADVVIRNVSHDPQTIGDWEVAGDHTAFVVGLLPGVSIEPGGAITVGVRFVPSGDMPQAATLILHSPAHEPGDAGTAQLNLGGIRRGNQPDGSHPAGGVCGVEIAPATRSGNLNSIQGALGSVHAAWGAVFAQQRAGVDIIHRMAGKELPRESSGWARVLDDVIAEGLVLAAGAVGLHLGAGLALAAWNALEKMKLKDDAAKAAKQIAGLTVKVHDLLVNDVTRSIGAQVSAHVREAIGEAPVGAAVPVVMREAFFLSQNKALARSYADAVTSLNNREGDFAALDARQAGLGFAALEAYRNHLHCQTAAIGAIQSRATLGMWASFLARMDLGTQDGSQQGVRPGADLYADIFKERRASDGEWRENLSKGVLELHVVWDKLHMATNPVLRIKRTRVRGLHPDMKAMMTTAPLREFPMPLIAHGNLYSQMGRGDSELGVGRNEGGAVWYRAKEKEESGQVLKLLGRGDPVAGSKVILDRIDDLTLSDVE